MLRKLYDWFFKLAEHKHATPALAGVSFAESSFFPIPPDVLLIPMVLAKRHRWAYYAFICTLASILGAILGYFIGALAYEWVGQHIVNAFGYEAAFEKLKDYYNEWGGWGLLFAAITPFPFKILTIFSGVSGFNLITLILISIIGRGFRFFLVAFLLNKFGKTIKTFIEKRLGLLTTIFMILFIAGFLLIKIL